MCIRDRGREAIIKVHAKGKPLENGVDFAVLAKRTPGFTGADLANICLLYTSLLGCVSGFGDTMAGPFQLRDVASRFMVLLAAYWGGAGAGAGVGALFGIVPSLAVMASPALVGTYSFSGLLAGAFNLSLIHI